MWVITESHEVFPWNLLSSGESCFVELFYFYIGISCCYQFDIHYLKSIAARWACAICWFLGMLYNLPSLRKCAPVCLKWNGTFDLIHCSRIFSTQSYSQTRASIPIKYYHLTPWTSIFNVYTDFDAVINSILRFFPPKQTLDVHFSGIGKWAIFCPFLSKTVTPLPVR